MACCSTDTKFDLEEVLNFIVSTCSELKDIVKVVHSAVSAIDAKLAELDSLDSDDDATMDDEEAKSSH